MISNKTIQKNDFRFQNMMLCAGIFGIIAFYSFASKHTIILPVLSGVIALGLYIYGYIKYVVCLKPLCKINDKKTIILLACMHLSMGIACFCHATRRYLIEFKSVFHEPVRMLIYVSVLLVMTASLILDIRFLYKSKADATIKSNKKHVFIVLGLILILVFLNINMFDTWPRWDNYAYLSEVRKLSVKSLVDLSKMRVANHSTYAYSMLYILVNTIIGDYRVTVYVLNYIYMIGGGICFYAIIRKILPRWNSLLNLLATAIFVFSPYFWGQMTCINLEFYCVFSLLVFLMAEAYKIPLLQFIGAFMLCFGKESGTVILAFIMAGRIVLKYMINRPKTMKTWLDTLDLQITIPVFILGVLWLVDVLTQNWMATNQTSFLTVDNVKFNNFGLSYVYMKDKLKTLFIANFNWLIISLIIVSVCMLIIRMKKRDVSLKEEIQKISFEEKLIWGDCLFGLLGALVISFLFVTYNHIRYNAPLVVILYIIVIKAVDIMFDKSAKKEIMCGMVALLLLIQCYITIDPLMLACMPVMSTGNGFLVSSENNAIESKANFIDSVQYNRQIYDFDIALDMLISKINYDDNVCILFSREYIAKTAGDNSYCEALHLIGGYGYQYVELPQYISWDFEKNRRYLSDCNDDKVMNIFYVNSEEEIVQCLNEFERVYYIRMPWEDLTYKEIIEEKIMDKVFCTATYHSWSLNAYELK